MKFLIALFLFFSQVSYASDFRIVYREHRYLCLQRGCSEEARIALACYNQCRDRGNGHPYCESICEAHGVAGVKWSCYRRCIEEDSADFYCRSVCD